MATPSSVGRLELRLDGPVVARPSCTCPCRHAFSQGDRPLSAGFYDGTACTASVDARPHRRLAYSRAATRRPECLSRHVRGRAARGANATPLANNHAVRVRNTFHFAHADAPYAGRHDLLCLDHQGD